MSQEFEDFFNQRIKELDLTRTEVANRAKVSRQALANLTAGITEQAKLSTILSVARVLKVHPVYLFQLLLTPFPKYVPIAKYKCDATGFIADVTVPDNSTVMVDQVFTKIWAIQNIGYVDWLGRQLVCVDKPIENLPVVNGFDPPSAQRGLMPAQQSIDIPETLSGQTVHLSVEFTAPSYPCSVFSYWKMIDAQGEFCFPQSEGLSCYVQVVLL